MKTIEKQMEILLPGDKQHEMQMKAELQKEIGLELLKIVENSKGPINIQKCKTSIDLKDNRRVMVGKVHYTTADENEGKIEGNPNEYETK